MDNVLILNNFNSFVKAYYCYNVNKNYYAMGTPSFERIKSYDKHINCSSDDFVKNINLLDRDKYILSERYYSSPTIRKAIVYGLNPFIDRYPDLFIAYYLKGIWYENIFKENNCFNGRTHLIISPSADIYDFKTVIL
jgi:hypothetical protein